MKPFKPMLASEADLSKLKFPLLAAPKYDGIRCVVHPELGAVTRNLKPVPNAYIRRLLEKHAIGLDGELVVGGPVAKDCFQRTTSAVMSHDGEPEFTFWAFDAPWQLGKPFCDRLREAERMAGAGLPWREFVPHVFLSDMDDLNAYESSAVAEGWEGVMLRDPFGAYKYGRSTVREGGLLKLKRFKDAEAVVVGFEELLRNANPATTNALGLTERSAHKANMVPADTLGALRVRFGQVEFTIGSGYTQAQRDEFWERRSELLGSTVKFRYQEVGTDAAPRFPVFVGFRPDGA